MDDDATVTVGEGDRDLAARLSGELHEFNTRATGVDDQRGLSVQVRDAAGELVAGLSGWTWGSCAGIELVWVREDQRPSGHGARLLAAVEEEARGRGCAQIVVSSFTFQAPGFYQRHGYTEFGRTEGVPTAGHADVHLVKALTSGAGR